MTKRKSTRTTHFRIGGVVKAMNLARERLSRGLDPDEVDEFRAWIHSLVMGVERICHEHRSTPAQLPAPTYRAYCYLKELKIEAATAAPGSAAKPASSPPPVVRVRSLIATCAALQHRLAEAAMGGEPVPEELAALRDRFHQIADRVEMACTQAGASPDNLPAPSRRAYQWLKFLSQGDRLEQHLLSLRAGLRAVEHAEKKTARKHLSGALSVTIALEFYHLPALFRTKVERGRFHIVASEGFISAPPEVIEALVGAAALGYRDPQLAQVRQYAAGPAYTEIMRRLEGLALEDGAVTATRGVHHDLDAAFARVNNAYFSGRLEKPRLVWSRTVTHRKLGHYQPSTDTVMLSLTLDRVDIPEFLIDFIMYHELLHKDLGIRVAAGRQYAHTPVFRQAERRFRQYTEVVELLHQLGQKPV